jgi:hypothetical protein
MEELVNYLILYLADVKGISLHYLKLPELMTLLDCGDFSNNFRETNATYNSNQNRWIMNDGSGDWFGSECTILD